jgi:hypothetical protein
MSPCLFTGYHKAFAHLISLAVVALLGSMSTQPIIAMTRAPVAMINVTIDPPFSRTPDR